MITNMISTAIDILAPNRHGPRNDNNSKSTLQVIAYLIHTKTTVSVLKASSHLGGAGTVNIHEGTVTPFIIFTYDK